MLKHNYIGTEHVLLGLLREEEGIGARVLESLGVTLEGVREKVVQIVGPGDELTAGQIPFTPPAKKVLELALREALSLDHDYIGTEHILLGLARQNEGASERILLDFKADPERVRLEVIRTLSGAATRPIRRTSGATTAVEFTLVVSPDDELRRLLMAAGGRALAHERKQFGLADLLAAAKELQDEPSADDHGQPDT